MSVSGNEKRSGDFLTTILTANGKLCQLFHLSAFQFHGRMNISLQGSGDVGMPQNLTQRFGIETAFYTACCECVPQSVESIGREQGFVENLLVFVQADPGFHVMFGAGQQVYVVLTALPG